MTFLGSSLAWFVSLKNTWEGRANQAWGPSDIWNTGAAWETMYGTSQSDLAAMTADRNTWQGRANNAWGASRVWNSGPSFESQLPPGAVAVLTASAAVPAGADGWTGNLTSVTLNRTGQWVIMAFANEGTYAAGARIADAGGTPIGNYNGWFFGLDQPNTTGGSPRAGDYLQGSYANGTVLHVQGYRAGSTGNTAEIRAYFIPTLANPS